MSIDAALPVRAVTIVEWGVLREECERLRAESRRVCSDARRARSDAVEERLRSHNDRLERRRIGLPA